MRDHCTSPNPSDNVTGTTILTKAKTPINATCIKTKEKAWSM